MSKCLWILASLKLLICLYFVLLKEVEMADDSWHKIATKNGKRRRIIENLLAAIPISNTHSNTKVLHHSSKTLTYAWDLCNNE